MKIKYLFLLVALVFGSGSMTAVNAFWGNWNDAPWDNRWGGYDWNPYDVWDPRYWAEEFEGAFDDFEDEWQGDRYRYGGSPYQNYGGYPYRGYGSRPYGSYGGYPYRGYGYGTAIPMANVDDNNKSSTMALPKYNPYMSPSSLYRY